MNVDETEPEGPNWATGGVDAGDVARNVGFRWEGFKETLMIHNLVECRVCKRGFQGMGSGNPSQGVGCAGAVHNGQFVGFYGSCFDMEMLAVSGLEGDLDPVCDYCVFQWVREGRVTYLRETGPFDINEGSRDKYREMVHCVARAIAGWKW